MPEMTSKVNFFETSSGSLHEGDGQSSGYPAPLYRKINFFLKKNLEMFVWSTVVVSTYYLVNLSIAEATNKSQNLQILVLMHKIDSGG